MRFELTAPAQVIFGEGVIKEAGPFAAQFGKQTLVVTGQSIDRANILTAILEREGIKPEFFQFSGEPTPEIVKQGVQIARLKSLPSVIGIGGGSVLDAAKAIACLLGNNGEPEDYLEIIGRGKPITQPSYPFIAIPTTAGTGSEATRNAVLRSPEQKVKVSMRSIFMLPRLALVDPELTYRLPTHITAATGLDALTQLIEPYVSIKANPLIDCWCSDGIMRAGRSLLPACLDGENIKARRDMSLVGLFGGFALANAGLGAVHGIAAPLGGMFDAPHGAVCARILPFAIEVNLRALQTRERANHALERYDEIAVLLTGKGNAKAGDGISFIQQLCKELKIPPLSAYGVAAEDIPIIAAKSQNAGSMKGNPILLTLDEITEIIEKAL